MISPLRKILMVSIGGTLAIGALAYVASLAGDNQRLQSDLQTALSANASQQQAIQFMAQEMARQHQAVVERDQRNRATARRLQQTERRLRDAQNSPQITVVERECMQSDIPVGVFDILREAPHRNGSDPAGKDLPGRYFLFGDGGAAVRGPHLGGPGSLRQSVAVSHPHVKPGPRRDSGILQ